MEFPAWVAAAITAVTAIVAVVAGVTGKRAEKAVRDLVEQAVDYLVTSIAREVSYLFDYNRNREELKAQLKKLDDAVQRRVDEAKRNGDDIQSVENRLNEVNGKMAAAKQLVEHEEEKAKKRCPCGLCPNFKSRYQFSKKAVKEANSIAKLLGLFDSDYKDFESRRGAFDGVMEALEDPNLSIIGVYGMGGVGKTTLVKQAASQAKEKKVFDTVVKAAVTQTPNMMTIQNEIAVKLGMKFDVDIMDVRADRLRKRLREEKSVLIILDDIWSPLNLDEVGVPSGDQHMGCKILMTSRKLDLLRSMGSQKNLPIEILTEEEAWSLFKNKAGDIVGRSVEIQSAAREIAKKCARLPIAIVTVAKALKDKEELYWWEDALEKLERPSKDDDVYSAIELSYTFLKDENVKKTFLLCSIMGHNAAVEDLLIYCRGFGLFHDLDKIQKLRNRVLRVVSELKDSSLLLSSSTPGCFDMHDVVRDVAVSIASMDHHWLSLEKVEVSEDLSNEEIIQDCNLISFRHAEVSGLPDELECLNLTFLSMGMSSMSSVNRSFFLFYQERSSLKIPKNFLKRMQKLKALSFAKVRFSSLPFSIDFHLLKTLRTLYLFGCKLDDISIIGEMMNLEILNLRESRFEMLPREIVQLRKLKLLDLSGCRDLKVIPPNVLSGLSRLEELYLYDSFKSWEVVDEGRESPAAGSNASLVELEKLSHLATLEVHVGNVKAMPKDTTFFGKLERYKISIGPHQWYRFENKLETSRMLKLSDGGGKMFDDGLLRKVQNLCLNGVNDVTNLERVCLVESFSQLRVLRVSGCGRLNNLFSFSIARELHQLEEIEVSDCQNITELIAEKREEETLKFDKLNSLKLSNLSKLVYLCGVQKNLSSSRQERDGSNALCLFDHKVALPMLEVLEIKGTENLERLWPNQLAVEESFPKLTQLRLERCHKLLNVFPLSMSRRLQRLEILGIIDCKNLERLWPNQLADEESFPKLTQLRLERCHKLLNVFPLSMSRRLQRLEKLGIIDCKLVEEIFEPLSIEGFPSGAVQAQAENILTFEFLKLTKLELVDLPNLKSFYHQIHTINLPSLKKELTVSGCDKVGILFGSSQQEILINQLPFFCLNENLEEISMGWKDATKEICYPQRIASQYFCRLKVVRLLSFPEKMEIFPSNLFKFLTSLPNLHHLEIRRYAYFKEIWEEVQKELFQNLRKLEVRWCPKFKDNLVPSSLSFKNLVTLQVEACHGIIKLVTHSTVKSLQQLQEMRISSCLEIEEMIEGNGDDGGGGEVKDVIDFPQLKLLELKNLRKLESFCSSGNYTFQFPSLQTIIVEHCPKMKMFSQGDSFTPKLNKVKLRSYGEGRWSSSLNITIQEMFKEKKSKEDEDNPSTLEQLTLEWDYEMKEIWHSYGPLQQLPSQYFCTLKVVTIESFLEEMHIFPSQLFQFLISLPNLQRLKIHNNNFKEIFQSPPSTLGDQVQELRLKSSISVEKPWHDGVPQSASFGSLTSLEVSWCHKLKYLFPSSMVKSFVQLKTLDVSYCDKIEKLIILSEGLVDEERNNKMAFPQLDCLKLKKLPNLKRFCSGNRIEFPSLRKLAMVMNYPYMSPFSTVKENISMETCQADVSRYLFNEGSSFPILEQLTLTWNDGMNEIWHAYDPPQQLLSQCFPRLKVVTLQLFAKEMDIFSSQLLQLLISLPKLQRLHIHRDKFKPIFQSEDKPSSALEEVQVTFPAIKELALESISVEKLWHDDGVPQITSFRLLTVLELTRCCKLKYLFPSSMVKSFAQLKTLVVSRCDEMEQLIILSERLVDEERNNIMVFPQLDCLKLQQLPNLKRFCSRNRIEFPSLRKLAINECPVLSTSNEVRKNNISMESCHADVPQYLLNKGLSLPNLEELDLGWNDGVKEICHANGPTQQLASQYFCSLKVVRLRSFPEEMEIFPSQLFQFLISLPHLQGLEIQNANVKEIFKSPSSALEEVQLKEALFQNLVTLEVSSCDGIKKLVTHSTAKSLVQLQELRISCCSEIEEIIEGSGDDDDDEDGEVKDIEIRFPQLKHLELIYLRKLESLCSSGNYTFQFPSLETVIVDYCPKMKMFSQGDSYTPMLHKVKLSRGEDDEGRWSGSLNRTIEEMFKEKVIGWQRTKYNGLVLLAALSTDFIMGSKFG